MKKHKPVNLQNTVAASAGICGVGLHSGREVCIKVNPASADSGIVFKRIDVNESESLVPANFRNVTKTNLGTTICNKYGVEIATVEHLMAGLWGAGIDNALVEIDAAEVPIMDGSAQPFIKMVEAAGVRVQNSPRKTIRILDEIKIGDENRGAVLRPYNGFKVKFEIDFHDNVIGHQLARFDFGRSSFAEEIAAARTFGFKHEVDAMHKMGLGLGGSLENAIVVGERGILNDGGLRYDDEFVRHKILDSVGDLYLAGAHIEGEFVGKKSGHQVNNELLHALIDNPKAWEYVTPATPRTTPRPQGGAYGGLVMA